MRPLTVDSAVTEEISPDTASCLTTLDVFAVAGTAPLLNTGKTQNTLTILTLWLNLYYLERSYHQGQELISRLLYDDPHVHLVVALLSVISGRNV